MIDEEVTPLEQAWRYRMAFESLDGRTDEAAARQREIILRDWARHNERHGMVFPVVV